MSDGQLYLVATPIGNLEDISFRALRILKEVNLIACEDTRRTKQLCNYYDIKTPLLSYHEHNERDRVDLLISKLVDGENIAVVSDAGTPAISDPGTVIVKAAITNGIKIIPIPGPTAFTSALIASGLNTEGFFFAGFLPRKSKLRQELLSKLKYNEYTTIFYVSPHRYNDVIKDIVKCWDKQRDAVVARELTKVYETFLRDKIGSEAVLNYRPKGEICLVVSGSLESKTDIEQNPLNNLTVLDHYESYINRGMERKQAIKQVAKDRALKRSEVYDILFKN
ncbi:16S rRNA (cytidine(1402)-2'-O)-methyltransferase [Clostridium sp. 'deep sea']|uniref:16S rRNA (cytidine(1402)-2'-O)-methyltransferase n=1 Tax=Clostridium sp. 'deep sea' TaxID=2779445 RepID=UPI0018967F66|nr:16S rRNA (cytidine(1402)-2'-O)-methyltransferase [Clostridium sp. 'deep sea']QOR34499.1 16S rRNA (cytidine(1402)-2'-O)-methyltransferase [Clostridium sp. 'deep sea']